MLGVIAGSLYESLTHESHPTSEQVKPDATITTNANMKAYAHEFDGTSWGSFSNLYLSRQMWGSACQRQSHVIQDESEQETCATAKMWFRERRRVGLQRSQGLRSIALGFAYATVPSIHPQTLRTPVKPCCACPRLTSSPPESAKSITS